MAEQDDRPGYSFDVGPPPEASRFLSNKSLLPSFSWQDVEPEEHAAAFAVAKATSLDVLGDIKDELQSALDDGLTFAEFKKRLQPRLEARGWWGYGEAVDRLDGQTKPARLGTPRRLRTIYDANLRSARAAGQWERIQRTKSALPYLTYRLGPSERHRPHHETKEGLTLPVDDPFWDSWMPPNGWGCKCWVRQITKFEAEELGIDTPPPVETRPFENRRTGEVQDIPVGIDPGWQRNPGELRLRAVEDVLKQRLTLAPKEVRATALRDIATSWRMKQMATQSNAVGNVPLAMIDPVVARAAGVKDQVVQFSDLTRRHVFEEKADRKFEDLVHAANIETADRIYIQRRERQQPRLIFETDAARDPSSSDKQDHLALRFYVVFKESGTFLSSFHRVSQRRMDDLKASDTITVLKE